MSDDEAHGQNARTTGPKAGCWRSNSLASVRAFWSSKKQLRDLDCLVEHKLTSHHRINDGIKRYAISGNTRRTEHWALAAVTDIDQSSARIFHMKGNTDTFALDVLDVPNITKSQSYRGGFQVGEISGSRLHDLERWVTQIPVHRNNPKWDCQTWIIEILREMHMDGRAVVFDGVSESGIRKALGEEMANDEVGDELVEERLKN